MGDKSESSTSLEFKNSDILANEDVLDIANGLNSEILYCKSALHNAQKIIKAYQQENQNFKLQNHKLRNKCCYLEGSMNELMKKLIKYEEEREKHIQIRYQVDLLHGKMKEYEKTIEILEDKLLLLNLNIKKQEYGAKVSEKNEEELQRDHQKFYFRDDQLKSLKNTNKKYFNESAIYESSAKTTRNCSKNSPFRAQKQTVGCPYMSPKVKTKNSRREWFDESESMGPWRMTRMA